MLSLVQMGSFPPLFPSSKFLNKKPWHKLFFIAGLLYSASAVYSFFATLLFLLSKLGLIILDAGASIVLSIPMIPVLLPLTLFYSQPATNFYPATLNLFQSLNFGFVILMIYFLASIFLPTLLYTILLNGIYGHKWHS